VGLPAERDRGVPTEDRRYQENDGLVGLPAERDWGVPTEDRRHQEKAPGGKKVPGEK